MKATEVEREATEEEYCDFLDEVYEEVEVAGMMYNTSYVLREVDPTAFRCGKVDYEAGLDPLWKCGSCDTEYDNESEAEECCKDEE